MALFMRIQKYLRNQGIGSLRKCDELIQLGQVKVNNQILSSPTYYLSFGDVVECPGKRFNYSQKKINHIYYLFNKPVKVLSSHKDSFRRKLIFDYLPKSSLPLFYAGRLDYLSRGLMLVSSDGLFVNQITHPSLNATKEYLVVTEKSIDYHSLGGISQGFQFEDIYYSSFEWKKINKTKVQIILHEGKKQEIRNIFRSLENKVIDLQRVRIGKYQLKDLPEGKYRKFQL